MCKKQIKNHKVAIPFSGNQYDFYHIKKHSKAAIIKKKYKPHAAFFCLVRAPSTRQQDNQ
jgi:hypothetical protein